MDYHFFLHFLHRSIFYIAKRTILMFFLTQQNFNDLATFYKEQLVLRHAEH